MLGVRPPDRQALAPVPDLEGAGGVRCEHVCVRSGDRLVALPGLAGLFPSLVRDAVGLALRAGAPEVDVILAAGACTPAEVGAPWVIDALCARLDAWPLATVLVPDLRPEALLAAPSAFRALARCLARHRQVALLDAGPGVGELTRRVAAEGGGDLGFCRWAGGAEQGRHAWRSAAAVVAGLVSARPDEPTLVGMGVPLDAGRAGGSAWAPSASAPDDLPTVDLRVDAANVALVTSEQAFGRPFRTGSLPALCASKEVHDRLLRAAEAFALRDATTVEAGALAGALDRALRDLVARGLLVAAHGVGPPRVVGTASLDPAAPALVGTLDALLRPWGQPVAVTVTLRPGGRPNLEILG